MADNKPNEVKNWWNNTLEPKRSFRWEVEYVTKDTSVDGKVLIPSHYITSVKMPSFSFQKEEVDQIGAKKIIINPHPTFTPVEITFIDDEQNSVYDWIYWYFYNTGIRLDGTNITPSYGYYNYAGNYNFSRAANFFGSFKIYTLKASEAVKLSIQPKDIVTKRDVLTEKTENYKTTFSYKTPKTETEQQENTRQKKLALSFSRQDPNEQKYRIDEIELVKPFITDFKQSDLNYGEGNFITYTIQITYASYKYKNYLLDTPSYNERLKEKFGTPQVRSRAGQAPVTSGEPVLTDTDA